MNWCTLCGPDADHATHEHPKRIYPQRGDYVHVVEGGSYWIRGEGIQVGDQLVPTTQCIPILKGAVLVCSAVVEDDHGMDTERPSIWVQGKRGHYFLYPDSWAPQYGPPVKQALDELTKD